VSRQHILIIEDNLEGVRGLRSLLTLLGYEVDVAYSGTEGIDAAEKLLPEVILCDINLPDLDGWAVAEQLRHNLQTAKIRLIALTSCGTDRDRRRSYQAGFEHHLTKPVDLSLLLKLLPRPDTERSFGRPPNLFQVALHDGVTVEPQQSFSRSCFRSGLMIQRSRCRATR
jgi:CheY-like chemotaxis protein